MNRTPIIYKYEIGQNVFFLQSSSVYEAKIKEITITATATIL